MAKTQLTIRRGPSKVIQGTRREIAAQLEGVSVPEEETLTLIIPGEEIKSNGTAKGEATFAEILAPLQQDFEALGMNDDEHAEWLESLVKRARAELDAKAEGGNA